MTTISRPLAIREQQLKPGQADQLVSIDTLIRKIKCRIVPIADLTTVEVTVVRRRRRLFNVALEYLIVLERPKGNADGIAMAADGTLWQFFGSRKGAPVDRYEMDVDALMLLHCKLVQLDMNLPARS